MGEGSEAGADGEGVELDAEGASTTEMGARFKHSGESVVVRGEGRRGVELGEKE